MIEKEPKFKQGDKIYLRTDFYKFPEFKKYSRLERKEIAGLLNEELTVNCPQKNNLLPKSGMFVMPNKFFTHFKPPVITLAPSEIVINIDAPEHITRAECDSLVKQLKQTIDRLNQEQGDLYSSVYISWYNAAVKELEKRIVPNKRTYTAEQIQEAKNIVYDIMVQRESSFGVISISHHDKTTCASRDIYDPKDHTKTRVCASTTCSSFDEYNEHIGNMVAVCKLTDKKMPAWVNGDGK